MREELYRITTANACFGIVVQNGVVAQAAPIAGKITGHPWDVIQWQYASAELVPPPGWRVEQGAGGWRCVQPIRLWSTSVYTAAQGGAAKATEAARELEEQAERVIAERERQCAALRRYLRGP